MEVLKPNRKRRVTLLLQADVPPVGYATYFAQPSVGARRAVPTPGDLVVHERGAENRYLALRIADDGGLTVTDKATGQVYADLGHFYDVADVGDEYSFCPLPGDTPITTQGHPADAITVEQQDACAVVFRIDRQLQLPPMLDESREKRSEEEPIRMSFRTYVTVYADQPGVYVKTQVTNSAFDHKLTVNFSTGLRVPSAYVDESFLIAERGLKLPDSTGWVEDPTPLMHQRAFTDLSDGARGLAILNRGLPSVEVSEDGTIALTLLRAVGWLSRDDLWVRRVAAGPLVPAPGAQCLQAYTYEYAILPHAGDWRQVYATAYNYNAPLLGRRADTHPGLELREMNITRDDPAQVTPIPWQRGGHLPPQHSFVQVDPPELVLSAVTRSGGDLIVRVYNVTRSAVRGRIAFGFAVRAAARVNLLEEAQEALAVDAENAVAVDVPGAGVVTVKVSPAE